MFGKHFTNHTTHSTSTVTLRMSHTLAVCASTLAVRAVAHWTRHVCVCCVLHCIMWRWRVGGGGGCLTLIYNVHVYDTHANIIFIRRALTDKYYYIYYTTRARISTLLQILRNTVSFIQQHIPYSTTLCGAAVDAVEGVKCVAGVDTFVFAALHCLL